MPDVTIAQAIVIVAGLAALCFMFWVAFGRDNS
jgi:hypothetical protein